MPPPLGRDREPIYDFACFVESAQLVGRDGGGEAAHFVPLNALNLYWSRSRIMSVLVKADRTLVLPINAIRDRFLRIFSLLVYIDSLDCLNHLVSQDLPDSCFPLSVFHPSWPESPTFRVLFEQITKHQWKFFPLVLSPNTLHSRQLAPAHVLPIISEDILAAGDAASIFKIEVDASCNRLAEKTFSPLNNTYVLKRYTDKSTGLFKNEVAALTALSNHVNVNTVRYFGSFAQSGTLNIILEYTDGGNLLEFFNLTSPPTSQATLMKFWSSLIPLLQGLHSIHQLSSDSRSSTALRGIHQDIKPENILLQSDPRSNSPYDFILKLADFGLTHLRTVPQDEEDHQGLDFRGAQTYAAPECSHHLRSLYNGPENISPKADIWSMGCIFSEALTWCVFGAEGRQAYYKRRLEETGKINIMRGSGYESCFHNGVSRLNAVGETHRRVAGMAEAHPVMWEMAQVVEDSMLARDPAQRLSAKQLFSWFRRILDEVGERSHSESNSTSMTHTAGGMPVAGSIVIDPLTEANQRSLTLGSSNNSTPQTSESLASASGGVPSRSPSLDSPLGPLKMEPITIPTSVLADGRFAFKSSMELHSIIRGLQSQNKDARALKAEVNDMNGVLSSLLKTVASNPGLDFQSLERPLQRYGDACKDYAKIIAQCTKHSNNTSRPTLRDWTSQKYLQGDINDFRAMLAAYKSTINIALANANLSIATVSPEVLEDYQDMISDTVSDLEAHLKDLQAKINRLKAGDAGADDDFANEWHAIIEEKETAQQGLDMCAHLSAHIARLESAPTEPTQFAGRPSSKKHIMTGLSDIERSVKALAARLENHKTLISSQLEAMCVGEALSEQDAAQLARLQQAKESVRQCIEIVTDAGQLANERSNVFENLTLSDNSYALSVSTVNDLVTVRNLNLSERSRHFGGQTTDEIVQKYIESLTHLDLEHARFAKVAQAYRRIPLVPKSPTSGAPKLAEPFHDRFGPGHTIAAKNKTG